MYFYIIFQNSGDSIKFKSIHHDLVLEYIDFVNSYRANKFKMQDKENISLCISNLKNSLTKFNNTVVAEFSKKFFIPDSAEDFLDQDFLNKTHAQWVNQQFEQHLVSSLRESKAADKLDYLFHQISDDINELSLSNIIHKLNLAHDYSVINHNVHELEFQFNKIKFEGDFDNWIERPNLYKNQTSNSIANFRIAFNHYGRTLRNKFIYYDINLEHSDENTYNQLLGFVELLLSPVETIEYSKEYISWCNKNKVTPTGDYLNLGIIEDLEKNLLKYRKILYRNLAENNYFTLTTDRA